MSSVSATSAGRILVVGARNVCRSPLVAYRLAAALGTTGITVASAGTEATAGAPMDREIARYLSSDGHSVDAFAATELTADLVRAADLVLCMTRAQRHEVVLLEKRGLRCTWALADFSDAATKMPLTPPEPSFLDAPDASFVRRVAGAAVRHRDEVHARLGADADVAEPSGQASQNYDRLVQQVETLVQPIVRVLGTIDLSVV